MIVNVENTKELTYSPKNVRLVKLQIPCQYTKINFYTRNEQLEFKLKYHLHYHTSTQKRNT